MVTHLACSGHRGLPESMERLVDAALRSEPAGRAEPLVGFSCLADGADTLFARALLDTGGSLVVVVPTQRYRGGLQQWQHAIYDSLRAAASNVIEVGYVESDSRAHMAASRRMLSLADELVAVWDGQPARGYGDTAAVVDAAHEQHLPVTVIWPDGASRD